MEYETHIECCRLAKEGKVPNTDLVWVCVWPSHPMYKTYTNAQADSMGLSNRKAFPLTPVFMK